MLSAIHNEITITKLKVDKYKVANLTRTDNTLSITHNFSEIGNIIGGLHSKKIYCIDDEKSADLTTEIRQEEDIFLALLSLITKKHFFYNRTQKETEKYDRKECIKRRNKEKHSLNYFGIQQLEFIVNAKSLHRVFNESKFTLGGRFYGAYHETIPKQFRHHIKINGQETVELDYKAHHLRMSYHLLGIDYPNDPYLVLTTDDNERAIYKKLCLIAINAKNENKAIRGFRNAAMTENFAIDLTSENIRALLAWLKKVHEPIAEYIHSKKGLQLQYLDSQITEAILMSLTRQGIPVLSVHDSYIVPVQYEEQLQEAMMSNYEKLLKFEPILEKA
jgi:hypothetical protein